MKYLITESQREKVIFKYLNNQDFIQIERDDSIYLVNSKGDKYGQIRYHKKNDMCYISTKLIDEISSFFSLQEYNSKQVIGSWVENTLKMKVTNIGNPSFSPSNLLRIPSN